MDRPKKHRPKLYIVNLQWTPKDSAATCKLNGRCDDVMRRVMVRYLQFLGVHGRYSLVPNYRYYINNAFKLDFVTNTCGFYVLFSALESNHIFIYLK